MTICVGVWTCEFIASGGQKKSRALDLESEGVCKPITCVCVENKTWVLWRNCMPSKH